MKKLTNGIQKVSRSTFGAKEEREAYIVWWNRHIELFTDDEQEAKKRLAALVSGGIPDEVADKQIRGEL